jgi:hypothetical protein
MGATGMGKMKLSIDISKVIGGEMVNADKCKCTLVLTLQLTKSAPMIKVVFLIT